MFLSPCNMLFLFSQSAHRLIMHMKFSLFVSGYQHIELSTFHAIMNSSLYKSYSFHGQIWQATLQEIYMKKVLQ